MVGVPGKYKGCETCRARRIKCDNQRPCCKKCIDTGRDCAGYERETVFIVGTIHDLGRCSSHPPRAIAPRKRGKPGPRSPLANESKDGRLGVAPAEPLRPAWDDVVVLSTSKGRHTVRIAALHMPLHSIVRDGGRERLHTRFGYLSFPAYEPYYAAPRLPGDDLLLTSQCAIHLGEERGPAGSPGNKPSGGTCLFLYGNGDPSADRDPCPRTGRSPDGKSARRPSPVNFRTFPSHHFFVRVYRHHAIWAALINRQDTFLASPEWLATPWELHPKSSLDLLLDMIALLPSIFARADRIFAQNPTLRRRLMAQELLMSCLGVERQLEAWYSSVLDGGGEGGVFWDEQPPAAGAQIPFVDPFAFRDSVTAVMLVHHWAALVQFRPCVGRLYQVALEPVVDVFPPPPPALPQGLAAADLLRYDTAEVRELADGVCRGMDSALCATAQPDVLAAPLFSVQRFYAGVNASYGDAQLELMWCDAFRVRLVAKGQDLTDAIKERAWQDVAIL